MKSKRILECDNKARNFMKHIKFTGNGYDNEQVGNNP